MLRPRHELTESVRSERTKSSQPVNGFNQIGFTLTILAGNDIKSRTRFQLTVIQIPKISDLQSVDLHAFLQSHGHDNEKIIVILMLTE